MILTKAFDISKFFLCTFFPTFIFLNLINLTISQEEIDIDNFQNPYGQINHNNRNNRMEIPNQRIGGAHPGFRNIEHEDYMPEMNERNYHHPGMGGGMGNHQRHQGEGGQRHFNQPGQGMRSNSFNNQQPQKNINNSQSTGYLSIFNNWFTSSLYEILMIVFLLGFVYNCFCGKTVNDKHALAWYNANKQYFEERYSELGIKKDEESIEEDNSDSLPIIKDSAYLYKFYAAGYRYIKWLLVVLEFRKRLDTISLFTSMIFHTKDRIIYEVGISPAEEDFPSWVFCVCNKKDSKTLKKDYQDINFFCNPFEPSIMSDKLVLLSESNELYCDLFQNKVNSFNFIFGIRKYIYFIEFIYVLQTNRALYRSNLFYGSADFL